MRPQYPCKRCEYHRAEFRGTITDGDGNETPVFIHYCGERVQREVELEFGCGKYKEKVMN